MTQMKLPIHTIDDAFPVGPNKHMYVVLDQIKFQKNVVENDCLNVTTEVIDHSDLSLRIDRDIETREAIGVDIRIF